MHTDAKISVCQAVLGGTIRVEGIHEDLNVAIPVSTGSHTRMRLKGKGIQKVSGYGYGDHYIHLKIESPTQLDANQKALLQAYAELESNTTGTVTGFTYDKAGKKVLMEDPEGLVGEIRDTLEEHDSAKADVSWEDKKEEEEEEQQPGAEKKKKV